MKQNVCETERGLPALKIEYVRSLNQISTGSFPHCKSNRKKTSLSPTIQIDEKVSEEIWLLVIRSESVVTRSDDW